MRKLNKFIEFFMFFLIGGTITSFFITNSDSWKFYILSFMILTAIKTNLKNN